MIWDIDIDTGAVNGTLDISNLKINSIDLDTGAANLDLAFGNKNKSTDVKVDAVASNINIDVPNGNQTIKINFGTKM
jgi:DUF4097 and DUF4098 domain-containing protein YvlB